MEPDSPGESRRGGGTLVLYLGTVAAYADMSLTQPILPLLSREFGVGPARAGFTVSAVVLAIAAASSFYGPLSDVLGRKHVMVGATALRAAATLACAFAPTFGMLVVLRAVQGVLVPGTTAVVVVVAGIIAASVVGEEWGQCRGQRGSREAELAVAARASTPLGLGWPSRWGQARSASNVTRRSDGDELRHRAVPIEGWRLRS
jgi:YNFM family putative membrane transporter